MPNPRDGGFNLIWGTLEEGWYPNQIYVDLPPSFVPYGWYILVLVEELDTLELKLH